MNSGPPEQLPQCFLNLNWDHTMGAGGHLQSALGSIVSSSQSSSSPAAPTPAENFAFHKLIGLHSVANSGEEISPQSHFVGGPLNSPPKLNLSMMGSLYQHHQAFGSLPMPGPQMHPSHLDHFLNDPDFADRAARFSSFDGRNYDPLGGQVAAPEAGRLTRAPSTKSLTTSGLQVGVLPEVNKEMNNGELMNAREESSVSDPIGGEVSMVGPPGSNGKKRKAPPKGKGKDASLANPSGDPPKTMEEDKPCAKRSRTEGHVPENEPKVEQNDGASTSGNNDGSKQGKDGNKPPEPPKDYIHVRARRGQATDSHSLAERVRREKISQRMKLLQDLVPGCNKVTGKAVMLDEIINYVQSLQRQVEFLSMKLATVNPRLDFNNLANLLPKDIHQTCGSMPNSVYSLEASGMQSSFANQPQPGSSLHCGLNNGAESQNSLNLMDSSFHPSLGSHQPFLSGLENPSSQLGNFWEDDLQSVVQMDIGQGQELAASSHSFHGPLPTGHMKIEL